MKKKLIILAVVLSLVFGGNMTVCAQPVTMPDGTVFDAEYYAASNPDVVAVYGTNASRLYQHYVRYGRAEGRLPVNPSTQGNTGIIEEFDAVYYAQANPDVAAVYGTDANRLYQHYIQYGRAEGRAASGNGVTAGSAILSDIKAACSTQAVCESDKSVCVVDVNSAINPYDVIYDYGTKYNSYVEACNWSLVFDVEYYKQAFPMLAIQYHNDANLLFLHFRTVGVHEGRQGSANFNVGAYMANCDEAVRNAFGNCYAAYYIYYMMNYSTEKNVNTVTNESNSTPVRPQYSIVLTAFQKQELAEVNAYRAEVGASPLTIDSEFNAYAMYRAYTNTVEGWHAHDWAIQNDAQLTADMSNMYVGDRRYICYSENNVESSDRYRVSRIETNAEIYRNSEPHYRAMIDTKYTYIGISSGFWDPKTGVENQFDLFTDDGIDSAMYPHA